VRKEKLEKVANFGFECQIGRDFHKNFRSRPVLQAVWRQREQL
jgi:hypothetical protein